MRWTLKPKQDDEQIKALAEILKVDRLIAQLLLQRGVTSYEEAKKFFRPQLSDLHDPFLMKDMDLAVIRIENAILAERCTPCDAPGIRTINRSIGVFAPA